MAIPPLVLRIYADASGVTKGVAQAQTQVKGLRASIQQNAGLIKTGLAGAAVAGFAVAINAASDLGEAQNKANVVFGESVDVVNKFGETSAESFGIAQAEALSAAGAFGSMFDSAGLAEKASADMSVTMTKLAGDMASFNNEDPSEMLERLRSGLAGEAEPLRRFGVFISEARVQAEAYKTGIAEVGAELTDAQKIQARYNIILQDTKRQQGDFGRTVGSSLPNQLRVLRARLIDLAAKFGTVFLPVITKAVEFVNDLVDPLVQVAEAFGDLQGAIEDFDASKPNSWIDVIKAELPIVSKGLNVLAQQYPALKPLVGALNQEQEQLNEGFDLGAFLIENYEGKFRGLINTIPGLGKAYTKLGVQIHEFAGMTRQEQQKWAADTMDTFGGVGAVFETLASKAEVSAQKIMQTFRDQTRQIRDYRENLEDVARRNIPDEVLQQLIDLGLGGAGVLERLANANDREFKKMVGDILGYRREFNGLNEDLETFRRNAERGVLVNVRFRVERDPALTLGQRQHGGPVLAHRPYIVGERGPELFVPTSAGTVIPNHRLTGAASDGTPNIAVYIGEEQVEGVVVRALNRAGRRA